MHNNVHTYNTYNTYNTYIQTYIHTIHTCMHSVIVVSLLNFLVWFSDSSSMGAVSFASFDQNTDRCPAQVNKWPCTGYLCEFTRVSSANNITNIDGNSLAWKTYDDTWSMRLQKLLSMTIIWCMQVQSNCFVPSDRTRYVQELMKYIRLLLSVQCFK